MSEFSLQPSQFILLLLYTTLNYVTEYIGEAWLAFSVHPEEYRHSAL